MAGAVPHATAPAYASGLASCARLLASLCFGCCWLGDTLAGQVRA